MEVLQTRWRTFFQIYGSQRIDLPSDSPVAKGSKIGLEKVVGNVIVG